MTLRPVEYARADDGVHIAFQLMGVGRHDILYVPGQITNIDIGWEMPQYAAWLTALSRLGRVILVDRRGVGLSDRLSPGDLPTAEVLAADMPP